MIKLLKKIFKKKTAEIDDIADVNLACAILLIEVSYSDFNIDNKEINSIIKLFKNELNLSEDKANFYYADIENT